MRPLLWVVDDDLYQRQSLSDWLRSFQFRVLEFTGAADVLAPSVGSEIPTAVIMDLALSGSLNGFQLADRLTSEKHVRREAFIFMTGWFPQLATIAPGHYRNSIILDKSSWSIESVLDAIRHISGLPPA